MNTIYGPDKYVSPFTDFGFKRLFGSEANKELLRSFLNALLADEEYIEALEFMNPEQFGSQSFERKAVFDIYCHNQRNEPFIVEMQCARQDYFKDRALFYATFPIREQALKGKEWNFQLKHVYAIGILNFSFDNDPDCIRTVMLGEIEKRKVFYEKLKFIFVELPKFKKTEGELTTLIEKWLYALVNFSFFDERPAVLNEPVFQQLFAEAEIAHLSSAEQTAYEESLKIARDNYAIVTSARSEGKQLGLSEGERIGLVKGEQIGLAKGEQIGLAKGEQIGLAKGEQIGIEKCKSVVVQQMKEMGMRAEQIEDLLRKMTQ